MLDASVTMRKKRSPVLTVIMTILILAILTLLALAALHWYQKRSAELNAEPEAVETFL